MSNQRTIITLAPRIALRDKLYGLIRKVEAQPELFGAAGLLQSGLGALADAHVVLALVGANGVISSPLPQALRDALGVVRLDGIQSCLERPRVLRASHCVLVPVASTLSSVLILWRPHTAPAIDRSTILLAIAAATSLGVLDRFAVARAA